MKPRIPNPSVRAAANRRNAARSTGPKTLKGKQQSALNALRHGLSISMRADQHLDARIEALAVKIAGVNAAPARLEQARLIAGAQIDLHRIRRVKTALLNDPTKRVNLLRPEESARVEREALRRGIRIDELTAIERAKLGTVSASDHLSLAEGFQFIATDLARLERYERRALSRRKFAIREFARTIN
jgi:hypothetical protein